MKTFSMIKIFKQSYKISQQHVEGKANKVLWKNIYVHKTQVESRPYKLIKVYSMDFCMTGIGATPMRWRLTSQKSIPL